MVHTAKDQHNDDKSNPRPETQTDDENNSKKAITEHESDSIVETMARRYYGTRSEAESKRRKGERIYFKPGYGYYIVRPKQRDPSANIYW